VIAPARLAAYHALRAIDARGLDLPAALSEARDPLGDPRDRALAGEIVIGVLRWRGALDRMAATLARRPASALDPEVLDILRIGLYQLWQLQRVPPSAAVHDAVDLTRVARRPRASALVNAALRAFTRTNPGSLLPARPDRADADPNATLDYLEIALSHPRWLAARWLAREGFDAAEAWLRFNNSAAPLTLRVNTEAITSEALRERLAAEGIATRPAAHAPDALIVDSGNPLLTPLASREWFLVQDEASQLVGAQAAVAAGERVLDACASPGGKTLVMSNAARGGASIVAADVRERRVTLLRETLARLNVRASLAQLNLQRPAPFLPVFDCVLVDAPCSGLGTVRRDPDIKWRRQEPDLALLAARQRTLLRHAAGAVRPGGRLVYATCSSEPEENDRVVDGFLAEAPAFRLVRPAWRTRPHRDGLEAFFAAVLVKADAL